MPRPRAHADYEPRTPSPDHPNLLLKAHATASSAAPESGPEHAVDGDADNPANHWGAESLPAELALALPESRTLNSIRLHVPWDPPGARPCVVEVSADGIAWTVVAHWSDPSEAGGPWHQDGAWALFEPLPCCAVRVRMLDRAPALAGDVVAIEGFHLPPAELARLRAAECAWTDARAGLRAGFGSVDERYAREHMLADRSVTSWCATAWRGSRIHTQFVISSEGGASQLRLAVTPLLSDSGQAIGAEHIRTRWVRQVLGDGRLCADVLDDATNLSMDARTSRAVWVSVDVPADAAPGLYRGSVRVAALGASPIPLDLAVEVLPLTLPRPSEWAFRLDLWQNPFAVARYHGVKPWSPEHLRLTEPYLRLLADCGQKCVTTTIVEDPWGSQTFDPYESMVDWVRDGDGRWRFDYSAFDLWVGHCANCGIHASINCYSMVPWGNRFRYRRAETGDYEWLSATPGQPDYETHWRPFLADFVAHLRAKGWLERTNIAMDERPLEQMLPMIALIREAAPELGIALAGSNDAEFADTIDDWCAFISPALDPAVARDRAAAGHPTTFYVCCGPAAPNTFTLSPPAESAWLGWYAAAMGYSGFLRWAWDCWGERPLWDTTYGPWPAGDCFLVYPGPRTSVRLERLREGIQAYEQVRIIRGMLTDQPDPRARQALADLEAALAAFRYETVQQVPAAVTVREAQAALERASRVAAVHGGA